MSCNSLFNCYSPFVTTLCVCDSLLCGKIVNGRQSYDVALTGTLDVLIRTAGNITCRKQAGILVFIFRSTLTALPSVSRPGTYWPGTGLPAE